MSGPLLSLAGGALIGLAASALLLFNGRVTGVSGIAGGLFAPKRGDVLWRALFLAGLLVGGLVVAATAPAAVSFGIDRSLESLVVAGVLVGFGTRLGSGCTSGHGVCGLARLSGRSLVATATFMIAGAAVVYVVQHVLGGAV